ncbi:MAG: carbamoyltransferase C-terminal domain-containing protein [Bryobacteraceae bacterium]|nr:carbamoyltransferase C-terminal domain-containing protein [Bryobacteraceae bacterium]
MSLIAGFGGAPHDTAWAVLRDGRLAAAVEEKKVGARGALSHCLSLAKASPEDVAIIAVARPVAPERIAALRAELPNARVRLFSHHAAHAASAYFASGFSEATALVMDSGGDLTTATRWTAAGSSLTLDKEQQSPDSVAELYSRVAQFLGFQAREDEHKVQWMSAAGQPKLAALFRAILGEPWGTVDRGYYSDDRQSPGRFGEKFAQALAGASPPDVAASLQAAVAGLAMEMAGEGENLCLAGGLFFNALLVRAFETNGRWRNVFVQPAAGNAGTAIGAAYLAQAAAGGPCEPLSTLALGPSYAAEEVKRVIENCKLRFRYLLTTEELLAAALKLLAENKIVAWMQGPMEFGPRALGHRSILASPLDPYSSENLNVYIKRRESFRKFAAAVPAERAGEFFDVGPNARFLSTVGEVRAEYRKTFEAALLGGGMIRVHAVEREANPLFHRLLVEFGRETGLPVLYNTSFNLFGDPLVCTPRDAVRSFYSSGIDSLVLGSFILEK